MKNITNKSFIIENVFEEVTRKYYSLFNHKSGTTVQKNSRREYRIGKKKTPVEYKHTCCRVEEWKAKIPLSVTVFTVAITMILRKTMVVLSPV